MKNNVIALVTGKPVGEDHQAIQEQSHYSCHRCGAKGFSLWADGRVTCGDCDVPIRNLIVQLVDANKGRTRQ